MPFASRSWVGRAWLSVFAVVLVAVAVGLPAPTVASAATTTVNFETPVVPGTASPASGPQITNQYASDGFTFVSPSGTPVSSPVGGEYSFPSLYRDTANAHSGTQVLRASVCFSEGCSFNDDYGHMFAELSEEATGVSVYAGAVGGGDVELAVYGLNGKLITEQTEPVGTTTKVNVHLSVTVPSAEIGYFSVEHSGYGALEIDDLSLVHLAKAPAPVFVIPESGASGYQGSTEALGVEVNRFNGENDAVTLAISGLPTGVTLSSGSTTIPAGQVSTTLTFAVSSTAPIVTGVPVTVMASASDVSAAVTIIELFTVAGAPPPVAIDVLPEGSYIPSSYTTVGLEPCSSQDVAVEIETSPLVKTPVTLTLSTTGSTSGMYYSLSQMTVPATGGAVVFVDLQLERNVSGDAGATNDITITASDGFYLPASATVVATRPGGLAAQGLYVTQGSQIDNGQLDPSGSGASGQAYQGVTLVAGKKTVVRFYADAPDSGVEGEPGIGARLYGYSAGGTPLPGSPLEPDYQLASPSTTALPEYPGADGDDEKVTDAELESPNNAFTFTLPESWTTGGLTGGYYPEGTTIKLTGDVISEDGYGGQSASCKATDEFSLTGVKFTEVGLDYQSLITPVEMTADGVAPPPEDQVFPDAGAVFPLPDGVIGVDQPYFASIDFSSVENETNGACAPPVKNVTACGSQKNSDILGFFENYDDANIGAAGAFTHGVGVTDGQAYGITSGVGGSSVVGGSGGRPLTSVAHELGHQYGLVHASNACGGGTNGQTGESWPPDQMGYLDGLGLNTVVEPYQPIYNGADIGGEVRTHAFDMMSYCAGPAGQIGSGDPDVWISPRNWQQLVSNYGTQTSTDADHPSADGVAYAASSSTTSALTGHGAPPALAARAVLDPTHLRVIAEVLGGSAAGGKARVLIESVGPRIGPALKAGSSVDTFTLTALGKGGKVLASVPMAASVGGHIEQGVALVQLTGEVPARGVQRIEIATGGVVLASRTRPRMPPSVTISAPAAGAIVGKGAPVTISWLTSSSGHRMLTAAIDYSRNAGKTWRTVFYGADTGSAVLPSMFLTASKQAEVRVRVSDGFNQSDAVSGVFTAAGAPPQVEIVTRFAPGMRPSPLANLQLSGVAIDQADISLGGTRLHWYDGAVPLGTGTTIQTGPLPPGRNPIKLVARDPSGRTAAARMTIVIARLPLPYLTIRLPSGLSTQAKTLTFRADATIPATLQVGKHRFQLGDTLARERIHITPGTTDVWLHMVLIAGNRMRTPFTERIGRSPPGSIISPPN